MEIAVLSPHQLVRAGVASMLATCAHRAVVMTPAPEVQPHRMDAAVFDLACLRVGASRVDLHKLLSGGVPVVGLVCAQSEDLRQGVEALGVAAVVPESISAEELVSALERAVGRRPALRQDQPSGLFMALSDRERAVLALIGEGMTNQQIADRLFLSVNSVKTYVRSAYRKTGVTKRSTAVGWLVQHGLVSITDHADECSVEPDPGPPVAGEQNGNGVDVV